MKTILKDMADKRIVDRNSTAFGRAIQLGPGPWGSSYYIADDNSRFKE